MIINLFRLGANRPESRGYLTGAICLWGGLIIRGSTYLSCVQTYMFLHVNITTGQSYNVCPFKLRYLHYIVMRVAG